MAHVVDAGALSPTAARVFLAVAGIASVLATGTGDLVSRIGAPRAFRLLAVLEGAGIALLAVVPGAAFVSAVLFGAAYNGAVGVQAIAGTRLGASPSAGVAAVMGGNGVGLMLGPLAVGTIASASSLGLVLALGAALVALSPPPTRRRPRAACASRRPATPR